MKTSTETLTVVVRDRASEDPWGSGLTNPCIREVTIPAVCPQCGGPRGEPRWLRTYDDGVWYSVQVWDNPCGHLDTYRDVVIEAAAKQSDSAVTA